MMRLLSFAALFLATIVSASSDCILEDGSTGLSQASRTAVLQVINERRQKLANGEQRNGNTGTYLPKAKKIDPLIWDCDLEKDATTKLGPCPVQFPDDKNATRFYFGQQSFFYKLAFGERELIDSYTGRLSVYANFMRDTTTKIGCCMKHCSGELKLMTLYCYTDQPGLKKDIDAIYEYAHTTTGATTTAASTTTTAAATTRLPSEAVTTASAATTRLPSGAATTASAATTNASATAITPVSAGTLAKESATTATKVTTSCIPRRKATTTTYLTGPQQRAVFPPSASGSNDTCPQNSRMHDELRFKFLDMHNYHRAALAKGNVAKRNGNYLPQSSDMQRMRYDCALENDVIDYLSSCPSSKSAESTRPDVGENFVRVPEEATYLAATQKAVTSWWKVIGSEEGPGLQVYFRQKHVNSPIESFTQMGWSTSRKLGCAVARCGNDYVAACRYFPRGNQVDQVIYKKGTPCTACAAGSWCTEDALCTLS